MTEGNYASSVSSNSNSDGDLGLTHLPRSQDRGTSRDSRRPERGEQCPLVHGLPQNDCLSNAHGATGDTVKASLNLNLGAEGQPGDKAREAGSEKVSERSTATKRPSSSDHSLHHGPTQEAPFRATSLPVTSKTNVGGRAKARPLNGNKKSTSSHPSLEPNTSSNPREIRPAFSSFSQRPKIYSDQSNAGLHDQESALFRNPGSWDASAVQPKTTERPLLPDSQEQQQQFSNIEDILGDLDVNLEWDFDSMPDLADILKGGNAVNGIQNSSLVSSAEPYEVEPNSNVSDTTLYTPSNQNLQSAQLSVRTDATPLTIQPKSTEWSSLDVDLFGPSTGIEHAFASQKPSTDAIVTQSATSPSTIFSNIQGKATNSTGACSPAPSISTGWDQRHSESLTTPFPTPSVSSNPAKRRRVEADGSSFETIVAPYEEDIAELTKQNNELRHQLAVLKKENRSLRTTLMADSMQNCSNSQAEYNAQLAEPVKLEDTKINATTTDETDDKSVAEMERAEIQGWRR